MKLKELISVLNSQITIELSGMKKEYKSKDSIPEEFEHCEVNSIEVCNNNHLIKIEIQRRVPTLEELGYSFEFGV